MATKVSCDNLRTHLEWLRSILSDISSSFSSGSTVDRPLLPRIPFHETYPPIVELCFDEGLHCSGTILRMWSSHHMYIALYETHAQSERRVLLSIPSLQISDSYSTVHTGDKRWCFVLFTIFQYCQCCVTTLSMLPGRTTLHNRNVKFKSLHI
jgi:hypothetical protein